MEPTRVIWTPDGWIESDAPARPGFVAWRFPQTHDPRDPDPFAEYAANRMPRPPRLRDGRPRNLGKRR